MNSTRLITRLDISSNFSLKGGSYNSESTSPCLCCMQIMTSKTIRKYPNAFCFVTGGKKRWEDDNGNRLTRLLLSPPPRQVSDPGHTAPSHPPCLHLRAQDNPPRVVQTLTHGPLLRQLEHDVRYSGGIGIAPISGGRARIACLIDPECSYRYTPMATYTNILSTNTTHEKGVT